MTRYGFCLALLGMAISGAVGWSLGAVSSARVNTIAAMAYAESLDLQASSVHERALAAANLECEARVSDAKVAKASEEDRRQNEEAGYSEQILGLRDQLQRHDISEQIVPLVRKR